MNRGKKNKVRLLVLAIFEIFLLSSSPALALFGGGDIDIPSASEMAAELEQRYHIDQSAIQNLGEGINVSDGKASAPEVAVVFSPSNPTPGEKIIARALPSFFGNQKESLYYTWYIKH
ncbi:MAG: hypothetical protein M0P97_01375, partial [Candidatus Moranbacteria bacterium]|nr:hypothetical protein [Candidatus Moranbacteria bacterium]